MMTRKMLALVALATVTLAMTVEAQAGPIYMRSAAGQPWGENTNEQAMDAAFGAGNWQDLRYETSNVNTVFSATNRFVFLEGSDFIANELEAYLTTNIAAIEAWVAGGGSLFVNSAPNEGNGMSYGFGGVNLVYQDASINPVSAVDSAHPIFNGPNATTTSFSGTHFAHASVSGPGLTALIDDSSGSVFLAEKAWGLGNVLFGGMTTTNFHNPDPQAFNLRVNMLVYGAGQADQNGPIVPEPGSIILLATGGIGLVGGAVRRRRARKTLAA